MSVETVDPRWRKTLALFFVLAYSITWGFSWLGSAELFNLSPMVTNLGKVLLHHGPALAALVLVVVYWGAEGLKSLLKPLIKWQVGWYWYLFVFLFPVTIRLLAVGIDYLLGGPPPAFFTSGSGSGVPAGIHPLLLLVPVFLGVMVQAGLAEEIGWRGLALPWLQTRFEALPSSLILGILWAFWHYDPQRADLLLDRGALYPLAVMAFTLIMTWVYNSTGGSLLLMVLFHTASNTADWIVPTSNIGGSGIVASDRPFAIQLALMCLSALVIWLVYKGENLSRCERVKAQVPESEKEHSISPTLQTG